MVTHRVQGKGSQTIPIPGEGAENEIERGAGWGGGGGGGGGGWGGGCVLRKQAAREGFGSRQQGSGIEAVVLAGSASRRTPDVRGSKS